MQVCSKIYKEYSKEVSVGKTLQLIKIRQVNHEYLFIVIVIVPSAYLTVLR